MSEIFGIFPGSDPRSGSDRFKRFVGGGDNLFLGKVDGRTKPARRFRLILDKILSQNFVGPQASEVEFQLACRAAGLSVCALELETKMAAGEEIDDAAYVAVTTALLNVIGEIRWGRPDADDDAGGDGDGDGEELALH